MIVPFFWKERMPNPGPGGTFKAKKIVENLWHCPFKKIFSNYSRIAPALNAAFFRFSKMFWLFLSVGIMCSKGEQLVEVVDLSDLTIHDVFNNSYLAMFNKDLDFSGKHEKYYYYQSAENVPTILYTVPMLTH